MDDLQSLKPHLLESGVPETVADRWLGLALPQLVFTPMDDAELRAGERPAGWYGGHPRVPLDVDLGDYPHYIASVDCAALPPSPPGLALPGEGSLLLFATRDAESAMEHDLSTTSRAVLHVGADTPVREWTLDESPEEPDHFRAPFPLRCSAYWSLPDTSHAVLLLDDELNGLFSPYRRQLASANRANRRNTEKSVKGREVLKMGGYPANIQDDPCLIYDKAEVLGRRDWCLIAEWGASLSPEGEDIRTYWVMSRQDMAEFRYDRVGQLSDHNESSDQIGL
ncbi:DUF1963 domain-containing protein [Streptomonospora arabica]|uniref:DUF1963 domain-containing protein n=1 Tax=Streptomonospora arabica TaxID=412417 RepID=A0ABV9ST96_9ACTN